MKKRIAYLRPAQTLSQYEMDYVLLLRDEFDIEIFTIGQPAIGSEKIEATRLRWFDSFKWNGRERSFLNGIYSRFLGRRYHMPGLRRVLRDFDIVQANEAASEYSYQAAKLKSEFGFKLLLSASENQPIFQGKANDQIERIKFVIDNTDYAFCIPLAARDRLMEIGLPKNKIKVIGHGIDCERFSPADKRDWDKFRIGYCGRFRKEKGLKFLIEAVKEIDVELILLGEGPDEDELRSLSQSLGILNTKVKFFPPLSYHQIHTFYKQIDLFVLPSIPIPGLVEQFGFVLLEAMASGLPIIATKIGGIPEVIGGAGILIEPKNTKELKQSIIALKNDNDLRNELINKARERALKLYRRETVSEKIREVYRMI